MQLVNQKCVRRLCRLCQLQAQRVRCRVSRRHLVRMSVADPGHIQACDFLEHALINATLLPISPVMDAFTRRLALEVALISSTERVIGVLVALIVRTAWAPAEQQMLSLRLTL